MNINLKTILLWIGLSLIVSGPCALAHTDVTAEQARELIDSTNDLIVVDVREPSEYCDTEGHIPGALNYPWYSGVLEAQYGELPMYGPVLVVCGSGSRSNRAADFLDSKDFSMVYDMLGGMSANWIWETEPCVDPNSKYGGGTGEPNDPYQIDIAEQLNAIGAEPNDWDKHFKLMADIDLSDYSYDRAVIAPDINDVNDGFQGTAFTGVFDGNGNSVLHLNIQGKDFLGLLGNLGYGAEVRNLSVMDVNITGSGLFVGGLVGLNGQWLDGPMSGGGMILDSHSSGSVSGNSSVGGLVGNNMGIEGGHIIASYSTCRVSGNTDVGGLVGSNLGTITKCYSTGQVSGNESIGGLVGINDLFWGFYGIIDSCYSTGIVSGDSSLGGLVGYCVHDSNEVAFDCFWDIETSGQANSAGGVGLTTAEMQTASTFLEAGWDFVGETENGTEDIWSICEGTNYPRFVWQTAAGDFVCPNGITIDDFMFFMEHWLDDNCDLSNGYCQGTDLDQSGTVDVIDLEILFENWSAEN